MLTSIFLNLILLNSIFKNNNLILAKEVTNNFSCEFLVTNNDDFPSCKMMEERGCSVGSSYEGYYYDSEKKYGTANIIISSNVTKIKEYAFIDCFAIANVSFEKPSSLKVIGDNAFDGCYSIKSITIPSSVEIIGDYAFIDARRLKNVYFENDTNIKMIGYCAFSFSAILPPLIRSKVINDLETDAKNCREFSYKGDNLHSNITNNQNDVFTTKTNNSHCNFLVTNDDYPSCEMMEERGCYQYNGSGHDEVYYDSEKKYGTANIIISSNVTKIKEYAFRDCFAIAKVSFEKPSSLKVIGDNAFDGCYSIKSITIPSSVEIIGDYAFIDARRLKNVYFENDTNIKMIGYCALSYSVVVPPSIKNIIENTVENENCFEFFNEVWNTSYVQPIVNNSNLDYDNYTPNQNFINDNIDDIINDDFLNDKFFNDENYIDFNESQFYNNKYNFTTDSYMKEDSYTNTSLDTLLDIIPDDIINTINSYNVYLNFSKLYAYILSLMPIFNFTNMFHGPFLRVYQKNGTISLNNTTALLELNANVIFYSINHLLA